MAETTVHHHDAAGTKQPTDQAARDRIAQALDETLFVQAGAGSGKTTALVGRVIALVRSGVALRHIAAITFTEKAADELRDKLRTELEKLDQPGVPTDERNRAQQALHELDAAAVGTLHAFAQRLLSEFPVEAGLPPRVEVLDELASQIAFDDTWSARLDELLADPAHAHLMLLTHALRISHDDFRRVALAFRANWDLLEEHPPPGADLSLPDLAGWANRFLTACQERVHAPEGCKLAPELDRGAEFAERILTAADVYEAVDAWSSDPQLRLTLGRTADWARGYTKGAFPDLGSLRDALRDLMAERKEAIDDLHSRCLGEMARVLSAITLDAAQTRQAAGKLEFHDLLVLARRLVRDSEHGTIVRRALHDHYQRLLLDEFQDTDPIQLELAVRIAAPPEAHARDWQDLTPVPGRLFFVGDPLQSIYRFRRADIAQFLRAATAFTPEATTLSANFRTVEPVLGWVNQVFGELIQPTPDSQPRFTPLDAVRSLPAGQHAVLVLGADAHDLPAKAADILREREAADVVAAVRTAMHEGWLVHDEDQATAGDASDRHDPGDGGDRHDAGDRGRWRPARLGDITILLPTRTSLPALEQALEAAGIAYRAESSSLVYATSEIRDLLLALRAVDDPSDELSLVAALRSPLFGCSDADLFRWHVERRGRWNHQAPLPPRLEGLDPVYDGVTCIRACHRDKAWRTPSELLERIVRERQLLELGFAHARPLDLWRRVRFVIDQARAWSDAGDSGLRRYLQWAARQGEEGGRVAEVVLPETDVDAVRIMTVHAAKGLEFPIVIVSGLTTALAGRGNRVGVVWPRGAPPALGLSTTVRSEDYVAQQPIDEQLDRHERLRLLYVACTRARDHLVVSLHRKRDLGASDVDKGSTTSAEVLARACMLAGATHAPLQPVLAPDHAPAPPGATAWAWADVEAWRHERELALQQAARPRTIAATTLARQHDDEPSSASAGDEPAPRARAGAEAGAEAGAAAEADGEPSPDATTVDDPAADPGLAKDAVDLELPPWQRGRYGTAVGRAVHAVLQTVDLASGAGVDEAAAAQAAAEGVLGREALVAQLARAALQASVVQEAARRPHWREVYVAAPVGDTLLEGYVDLLYRADDGLVVVDYKTDQVPDDDRLAERLAHYRLQGAAYALAVERVTGERVCRCVFVFCAPEGPREVALQDLPAARDDVVARIAAAQGDGSRTAARA